MLLFHHTDCVSELQQLLCKHVIFQGGGCKGPEGSDQDVGVDMVTAFNFQNGAIKQALQANGGPLFYTCVDSSALQWSQILRQQLGSRGHGAAADH